MGNINKDELLKGLVKLATPIDFDELEKQGILKRNGVWYIIYAPDKLPDYVSVKAYETSKNKDGYPIMKFRSCKSYQKLLKKTTGKEYNEF